MAQWMKGSLHKHGVLSSDPQYPREEPGLLMHICDPNIVEPSQQVPGTCAPASLSKV